MTVLLKFLPSIETLDLRQKVLRPQQSIVDCIYPNDDSQKTFHVGGFVQKQLVGVATFLEEPYSDLLAQKAFRLRGMATDVNFRSQNIGRSVLQFGIQEIQQRQGDLLWCNAREIAFEFYEKMGLKFHGPLFEMKGIGPHKVMYKYL